MPSILRDIFGAFYLAFFNANLMTFNKLYTISCHVGKQKSKIRIWTDNFIWGLKFKEVNNLYYVYGMDLIGKDVNSFIAYSEFRVLRNILNIRAHENRSNTKYCFNYLALARDKFVFSQFCKSLDIPHPKTYGLTNYNSVLWFVNGKDTFKEYDSVLNFDHLDVFCKEISGGGGRQSFQLKVEKGKIFIDDKISNLKTLADKLSKERFLIQQRVTQHKTIHKIYPESINTIRLMTFLKSNGSVEIFDAYMRFGDEGRKVDNLGQGGIGVGVNIQTGQLNSTGFCKKPGRMRIVKGIHNYTNVKFANIKVPFYKEAVEYATKLHKAMYGMPSMGWDIALTPNGPVFLEAGEDWEIGSVQCHRGGVKENFYELHGFALDTKLRRVR